MNLIRCEACGASNLLKDGDYFVCEYCGCKYRKEDILVHSEGRLNISNSNVVINNGVNPQNILTIARRAHHDRNSALAKEYYDKFLEIDPSSWEAYFYKLYYDVMLCYDLELREKCEVMMSGADTVLKMLFDSVLNQNDRRNFIRQIAVDFMYLEEERGQVIINMAPHISKGEYYSYVLQCDAIAVCIAAYCNAMYDAFGNAEAQLYYDCWCRSVFMFSKEIDAMVKKYGRGITRYFVKNTRNKAMPHIEKIKQYNPQYVPPRNLKQRLFF